jgi:hypothetical protein
MRRAAAMFLLVPLGQSQGRHCKRKHRGNGKHT